MPRFQYPVADDPREDTSVDSEYKGWWERYSPHGEFPWSTALSLAGHVFLVLIVVAVVAGLLKTEPPLPVPVGSLTVIDEGPAEESNVADGLPGDDTMKPMDGMTTTDSPPPELEEIPDLDDVKSIQPVQPEPVTGVTINDALEKAASLAEKAKDILRNNLDRGDNQNGKPGSGGGGVRGERQARWVLSFSTTSTQAYLAQMEGIGMEVAFPVRGRQWRYYRHLTSRKPASDVRDIDNETRMHWIEADNSSARAIAQALGVKPLTSEMFTFAPEKLEARMLQMELAYQNLEEHEIAATRFRVVHRGGGYNVIVESQTPK